MDGLLTLPAADLDEVFQRLGYSAEEVGRSPHQRVNVDHVGEQTALDYLKVLSE